MLPACPSSSDAEGGSDSASAQLARDLDRWRADEFIGHILRVFVEAHTHPQLEQPAPVRLLQAAVLVEPHLCAFQTQDQAWLRCWDVHLGSLERAWICSDQQLGVLFHIIFCASFCPRAVSRRCRGYASCLRE